MYNEVNINLLYCGISFFYNVYMNGYDIIVKFLLENKVDIILCEELLV